MKTKIFSLKPILLILLVSIVSSIAAQETPIAFCDDIKIIDSRLGVNVPIFSKYSDFQQATLIQTDDGLFLNIVYKVNNVFSIDKVRVTESEVEGICQEIKLATATKKKPVEENFSQEGRRRLIFASTLFSLSYYSWAIPTALKFEDYKAYTASYMLIGGAGFFGPMIATRNREVTYGMVSGYLSGAQLGLIHGGALTSAIHGDDYNERTYLGLTSLLSIGESLIGLSIAKKYDYTWGQMSLYGSGGTWGAAYGMVLPKLIFNSENTRTLAISALAGSAGGLVASHYFYKKQPVTNGDVSIISSSGLLGLYLSTALMASLEMESIRANIILGMLGASGGLTYGIMKTKNYDYTYQQSNLISLGSIAGGFVGAGLGVLTEAELKGYMWYMSLGATGGFLLTDYILAGSKKQRDAGASNFKININPGGVMGAFNSDLLPYKQWDPRYSNSIVNMRLTF
jgi:hypothetical protein